MRQLVYHIACSVDGYIADPNGGVGSFLMQGQHADDFIQSLGDFDGVIMGSNTYTFGYAYGLKPGEPAYPGLTHYIVSEGLNFNESSQVRLIKNDVLKQLSSLKAMAGKPLWLCGGGNLAGQLANAGLIDRLILKVNPAVLGAGIPLFENLQKPLKLALEDAKSYKNGVQLLSYTVLKTNT